jgi:hypothetical protein
LFERYCKHPVNRGILSGANLIGPAKPGDCEPLTLYLKLYRDAWGMVHVGGASFEFRGEGEIVGYACVLTHLVDCCPLTSVRRIEQKDLLRASGSSAENNEFAARVIEALRQTLNLL